MKNAVAIFLAILMLAAALTSCRITARKHIRPLFFYVSAISMES
ncbi:MAG: hypothetical protein QM683_20905 [Lacrimispora sp.]